MCGVCLILTWPTSEVIYSYLILYSRIGTNRVLFLSDMFLQSQNIRLQDNFISRPRLCIWKSHIEINQRNKRVSRSHSLITGNTGHSCSMFVTVLRGIRSLYKYLRSWTSVQQKTWPSINYTRPNDNVRLPSANTNLIVSRHVRNNFNPLLHRTSNPV